MQPQGTSPINTDYFTKLADQVSGCKVCAELQTMVNNSMASLQAYKTAIDGQMAALAPILALLTPPTSPTAAVTWIGNFITAFITPAVIPYTTYAAQITALASNVSTLSSAISTAAGELEGCSITVPPIV